MYPEFMVAVYGGLVEIYGTARQVEAELAHLPTWRLIRSIVRKMNPLDPSRWLPEAPMRRHHYAYMKRRMLTDDALLAYGAGLTESGTRLTLETGNMDPSSGSFTHPDLSQLIYADGKVITPIFKGKPGQERVDVKTGEIRPVRFDPDAFPQREGGIPKAAYGTKFAIAANRCDSGIIVLGAKHVGRRSGGEAKVISDLFDEILPSLPGCRGVAVDGAWHGVNIQHLITRHGVLSISPVAAAAKATAAKKRKPKESKLEVKYVRSSTGVLKPVPIYARDGAAGVYIMDSTGKAEFHKLRRTGIIRNRNKRSGTYRIYQSYLLPDALGGEEITLRLFGKPSDEKGPNRRPEYLRAIPAGDADYSRLYGRRADSESLNRVIENRLYWNRAHSVGYRGQLFDLICLGRLLNATTKARHRARAPLVAQAI